MSMLETAIMIDTPRKQRKPSTELQREKWKRAKRRARTGSADGAHDPVLKYIASYTTLLKKRGIKVDAVEHDIIVDLAMHLVRRDQMRLQSAAGETVDEHALVKLSRSINLQFRLLGLLPKQAAEASSDDDGDDLLGAFAPGIPGDE